MLGYDIAAALPEFRAQAEALMQDSCRITSAGEPVWDDATGTYTPGATTTVYEGKCQLPRTEPNAQDAESGEALWAKGVIVLKLPMNASGAEIGDPLAVADGHEVEITSRPGLFMTARFVIPQTWEKSRKVSCQVVTRDG